MSICALYHFPHIEESSIVRNTLRLLHIMGNHNDRVFVLQCIYQLFNSGRRDWIQCTGCFIHEKYRGFYRQGSGNAQTLLLPAGQPQCRLLKAILKFIPDGCLTKALFYNFIQYLFPGNALQSRTIGYIIINTFWEWIWLLENHTYITTQHQWIHFLINIYTIQVNASFNMASANQVIHSV